MNPDDKFQEEMLDDIREAAVKARDAANALDGVIRSMRHRYPCHPAYHEMWWWMNDVVRFSADADNIATRAEELADAGGETAEGGEE